MSTAAAARTAVRPTRSRGPSPRVSSASRPGTRIYERYPIFGKIKTESVPLIGSIYSEDEIWSCTTCGACEEECPVGIEYIDKMVDLRRGMVDEGLVPQSLQKPMSALEKRGNPWGKLEKKRAEWTAGVGDGVTVKLVEKGDTAEALYFVDSITSYDDRMQKIAQATARVLGKGGIDFVVIGKDEKDSGHDVRRFGEEMLFQSLKEQNTEAIKASGARRIVVNDPHALNALRNDYADMPPVQHVSELIAQGVESGKLKLEPLADSSKTYTYPRPLLPRPPQRHLRRAASGHRLHPRAQARRDDGQLPGPFVLLRRWRPDALLRARRGAAHGRRAGASRPGRPAPTSS